MKARHRQSQVVQFDHLPAAAVTKGHGEDRLATIHRHIGVANVGLRIGAIGDDTPVLDGPDHRLDFWMVETHDGKAVEGTFSTNCRKAARTPAKSP